MCFKMVKNVRREHKQKILKNFKKKESLKKTS